MTDIQTARKALVFEVLGTAHFFLVMWWWIRGYQLYFLKASESATRSWWFRMLDKSERLLPLNLKEPLYLYYNPAGDKAFEVIDRLYASQYQGNWLVRKVESLYDSATVHLAFKKALLLELEQYVYYRMLRQRVAESVHGAKSVMFMPGSAGHHRTCDIYDRFLDSPPERPIGVNAPIKALCFWNLLNIAVGLRQRIRLIVVVTHAIASAIKSYLTQGKCNNAPIQYEFAVAVVYPPREFANEIRSVDFLLDGKGINKDNTVLVSVTKLSPEHQGMAKSKGLAVIDGQFPPSGPVLRKLISMQVGALGGTLTSPAWIADVTTHMAKDYWTWNSFLDRVQINNYITYADFGIGHVARNILFDRHDTRTWYYLDTANTGHALTINEEGNFHRHVSWGFLTYDYCVAWNQGHIDYFKMHKQEIKEYFAVGSLWSEHVRLLRDAQLPTSLSSRLSQASYSTDLKLVAVFDASAANDTITDFKDLATFLQHIEQLLEDDPNIFVVLKEKRPRVQHAYSSFTRGQGTHGVEKTLEQLDRHPRCYLPGYTANPSEIMALSDLTISFPFTSTTLEALGAGRKAIYHDATSKMAGTAYARIPKLVSHGYPELKERVSEVLYATSDDEYALYLEDNIKGVLDPYLDGRGLTRFRQLLCRGVIESSSLVEATAAGVGNPC